MSRRSDTRQPGSSIRMRCMGGTADLRACTIIHSEMGSRRGIQPFAVAVAMSGLEFGVEALDEFGLAQGLQRSGELVAGAGVSHLAVSEDEGSLAVHET